MQQGAGGMGMFQVTVKVANPKNRDEYRDVDMIVDTGATHSMLPGSLLDELGIARKYQDVACKFGNEQREKLDLGEASITIGDVEWSVPVLFSEKESYFLGATTLQTFNLMADPNDHRLIEMEVLHVSAKVMARGLPVSQ